MGQRFSLFVHSWLASAWETETMRKNTFSVGFHDERRVISKEASGTLIAERHVRHDEGVLYDLTERLIASSKSKLVSQPVECSDCLYRTAHTWQTAARINAPSVDQ